jgi:hypothetical protein
MHPNVGICCPMDTAPHPIRNASSNLYFPEKNVWKFTLQFWNPNLMQFWLMLILSYFFNLIVLIKTKK